MKNDKDRLHEVIEGLSLDDAMLANRIICQGSDPSSLAYILTGYVPSHIANAHRFGPGGLKGEERWNWLLLASQSMDESKLSTLQQRVEQFAGAVHWLQTASLDAKKKAVNETLFKIVELQFTITHAFGVPMRSYKEDLGFAAAYWEGEKMAAVVGHDAIQVGSNGVPLAELGVKLIDGAISKSPFFMVLPYE